MAESSATETAAAKPAQPKAGAAAAMDNAENLVEAEDIIRDYRSRGGLFKEDKVNRALKGVSFCVKRGKTLAIVGESGCGKSTLARILTLIDAQTAGILRIDGEMINIAEQPVSAAWRRKVQMVFQNPYASLNPRAKIGAQLAEPLLLNTKKTAAERRQAVAAMLEKVGLEASAANRYPHMFSGGQRQRIAIARALMLRPQLLVLDEPVSALDLSVQAQVLNLLADLQDEFHLTYIFISHDLSVVRYIADDILVMCFGEVAEYGPCEQVFRAPQHAYTKKLFAAQPHADIASIKARLAAKAAAQLAAAAATA